MDYVLRSMQDSLLKVRYKQIVAIEAESNVRGPS